MAALWSAAAEMSTASMKDLSAFCDKTLSAQGYSMLWKRCDRKRDRAELGENHSIDIKKKQACLSEYLSKRDWNTKSIAQHLVCCLTWETIPLALQFHAICLSWMSSQNLIQVEIKNKYKRRARSPGLTLYTQAVDFPTRLTWKSELWFISRAL